MILPEKTGTDLERLEILNAAARRICEATPALDQLPLVLQRPAVRWSWREFLGYMLGPGPLGSFWWLTAGWGGLGGHRRCDLPHGAGPLTHRQNKVIYTTVACFLSGILAQLVCCHRVWHHLDRIMIGDIMLFIPGLVIVNGVREFFYADILTGVYRLIEALLIAGAIAVGYAVSLVIGGQIL